MHPVDRFNHWVEDVLFNRYVEAVRNTITLAFVVSVVLTVFVVALYGGAALVRVLR